MLFNSFEFLVFFPVVTILYFVCTHFIKRNWASQLLLLAASLYFYACWNPAYLALILTSVFITYASGLLIERSETVRGKRFVLASSLVLNLGILFLFKYYGLFAHTVEKISMLTGHNFAVPAFSVLLPVGISFYTFQALGYSIDVYRGKVRAEHNLLTYALFVTFFPQLVAGPIERTGNLLPQFKVDYSFDYDRVTDGLKLATWGMFKKVIIADNLAVYVTQIFDDIPHSNGCAIALAAFFFSFQILCDFSGYSDIAVGVAKVLGFNLMTNFRRPYFAKTIAEFWRRWHISLSAWFKDYVYFPLGGSRVKPMRHYFNLMATFLISGLWHGAAWKFVLWGGLHGAYQVVGLVTRPMRQKLLRKVGIIQSDGITKRWWQAVQVACTFCLVCFAWIAFRANRFSDFFVAGQKLLNIPRELWWFFKSGMRDEGSLMYAVWELLHLNQWTLHSSITGVLLSFAGVALLLVADWCTRHRTGVQIVRTLPLIVRWVAYYALVFTLFWCGYCAFIAGGQTSEFIYFQF